MPEPTGTTRRRLIQVGLLGAGATALAPAAEASAVPMSGHPDYEDPRFTVAVIPDTQYLFDLDRGDRSPLDATVRYLNEHRRSDNIVFAAHLGDVTENGQTSEITEASAVLHRLERKKWIKSEWTVSEYNQKVKIYLLTAAGKKQLAAERTPSRNGSVDPKSPTATSRIETRPCHPRLFSKSRSL